MIKCQMNVLLLKSVRYLYMYPVKVYLNLSLNSFEIFNTYTGIKMRGIAKKMHKLHMYAYQTF